MQKFFEIILVVLIFFSLTIGCAQDEATIIEGTIIKVEEDRILVSQKENIIASDLTKSLEELIEEDHDLVWIKTKKIKQKLVQGEQVNIWISGNIVESYPAQATAEKIDIIE